jgi:hypothetical protein
MRNRFRIPAIRPYHNAWFPGKIVEFREYLDTALVQEVIETNS